MQYLPAGWSVREKAVPRSQIDLGPHGAPWHPGRFIEPALKFYGDVLGFRETWRGSSNEKILSWVNAATPDSTDYVEFMLYDDIPAPDKRGTQHHICLFVPDMDKAVASLEARPARKEYKRTLEFKTGVNRKRQCNLFDPDGTRVELMEPHTIDGKPAPSSKAPPPR